MESKIARDKQRELTHVEDEPLLDVHHDLRENVANDLNFFFNKQQLYKIKPYSISSHVYILT